jgi:O-succinylbenzoic acid--CoA ligase
LVVSGGVNVALGAVERRLLEHPALSQVAVVAVPDPTWGALVVAHVVPRDRAAAAPGRAELRDFVAAGLPRPWAPREIVVRAGLPLLESGKVDRLALLRESRERG